MISLSLAKDKNKMKRRVGLRLALTQPKHPKVETHRETTISLATAKDNKNYRHRETTISTAPAKDAKNGNPSTD